MNDRRLERPIAVLAAGAVAMALSGPTSAHAETIALPKAAVTVASYGNVAAWSQESGAGFRLVLRDGGRNQFVPVAPRDAPFDVRIGPRPRGSDWLVYSRCARDATSSDPVTVPFAGHGCRLYAYDTGTKREMILRGTHRQDFSEGLPSVWGSKIAFVRQSDSFDDGDLGGAFGAGPATQIIEMSVAGRDARTVRGGPRTKGRYGRASGVALHEETLSYTWDWLDAQGAQRSALFLRGTERSRPRLALSAAPIDCGPGIATRVTSPSAQYHSAYALLGVPGYGVDVSGCRPEIVRVVASRAGVQRGGLPLASYSVSAESLRHATLSTVGAYSSSGNCAAASGTFPPTPSPMSDPRIGREQETPGCTIEVLP
jgi:hypothetical protein